MRSASSRGGSLSDRLDMSLDDLVGGASAAAYGKALVSKPGKDHRAAPYNTGGASGNCRVFVGNLPYSVRWQDLKDHMRAVGSVVHCDIIAEPGTAMGSKGCGLVEFSTPSEAERAIRELSDTELGGRPIFIREDREALVASGMRSPPRSSRATASSETMQTFRSCAKGSCGVFVGNLAYSVTWKDLKDHMRAAGEVIQADIIAQPGTTMGSKGCGLVRYSAPEQARRAIRELTESILKGRAIFVREDREEDNPAARGPPPVAAAALLGNFMQGSEFGGRSRVATSGGGSVFGGSGSVFGGGGRALGGGGCRVFVGNLPYSVTWRDLKDHMRGAGNVVHCDILPQPGTTMNSRGCGIVEYASAGEARRAMREMMDTDLKGRLIFVREDREE